MGKKIKAYPAPIIGPLPYLVFFHSFSLFDNVIYIQILLKTSTMKTFPSFDPTKALERISLPAVELVKEKVKELFRCAKCKMEVKRSLSCFLGLAIQGGFWSRYCGCYLCEKQETKENGDNAGEVQCSSGNPREAWS